MKVEIENIQIGKTYSLRGIIENGKFSNGELRYSRENVHRPIKRITDDLVICACDRRFLREGLTVETVSYETY